MFERGFGDDGRCRCRVGAHRVCDVTVSVDTFGAEFVGGAFCDGELPGVGVRDGGVDGD